MATRKPKDHPFNLVAVTTVLTFEQDPSRKSAALNLLAVTHGVYLRFDEPPFVMSSGLPPFTDNELTHDTIQTLDGTFLVEKITKRVDAILLFPANSGVFFGAHPSPAHRNPTGNVYGSPIHGVPPANSPVTIYNPAAGLSLNSVSFRGHTHEGVGWARY